MIPRSISTCVAASACLAALLAACSSGGDGSPLPSAAPGQDAAASPSPEGGADAAGQGDEEAKLVAPEATPPDAAPEIPPCVPACQGLQCGDDGCGGNCGSCTNGLVCDLDQLCEPPGPSCPAPGPYGTKTGNVFPQVTFQDCAGNDVALHDVLCGLEASHLFILAGW